MIAIMTGLTSFKGNHRMIHSRIGKGAAWILMTVIAIDFRAIINNRDVGAIRIVGYIRHTGSARRMAAGRLAAAGHAGVVEGRGIGERCRSMTGAAVCARHNMICRLAGGAEDGAAMTVGARLAGRFRAAVVEGAPGKRCG